MRFSEEDLRKLSSEDVRDPNPELFAAQAQRVPKANKYGAKKTEVDGIIFDSGIEAQRYRELLMMEQAGLISDLQLQVPFILQESFVDADGNKQRQVKYTADFTYVEQGIRDVAVHGSHIYREPGGYTVTVTANYDAGSISSTLTVNIESPTGETPVDQPNAFRALFLPMVLD